MVSAALAGLVHVRPSAAQWAVRAAAQLAAGLAMVRSEPRARGWWNEGYVVHGRGCRVCGGGLSDVHLAVHVAWRR